MDISRAISRFSRPLAIFMVVGLRVVNLNLVVRIRPVDILIAFTTMAISSISRSLVDVVAIFVRFWVSIAMVLLLNMDISRAISRFSRPLAISMVVGLRVVNLNLVVRIRPVDILIAFTAMAISSISRSLLVIMLNLISIRSMVVITFLLDIRMSMTMVVSKFSRSLVMAISLNSLGTSMVVAYSRAVFVPRFGRPLAIIALRQAFSSSVYMAVTSIAISWFSRSLPIITLI